VGHKEAITSLCKAADDSHFLTGSHDKTAKACASFFYLFQKYALYILHIEINHLIECSFCWFFQLWDMRTLTLIKTYTTVVPVNAVAMSPLLNHVCTNASWNSNSVPKSNKSWCYLCECFCSRSFRLCLEVVKMHQLWLPLIIVLGSLKLSFTTRLVLQ